MYKIYGLYCPIRKEICYVGHSKDPELRLSNHFSSFMTGNKYKWLQALKFFGLKPEIKILVSSEDRKEAKSLEYKFIRKLRLKSENMYNVHPKL